MITLKKFGRDGCPPCFALTRTLDNLKAEYGDKIEFIEINVEKDPKSAAMYKVTSVPQMFVEKDGEQVWHHVGAMLNKPLREKLDELTQ